jgi:hypothetical protein
LPLPGVYDGGDGGEHAPPAGEAAAMSIWPSEQIPDPATAPLLSPDNIGKGVWVAWNGNTRTACRHPIVAITRSHVHVNEGRIVRYKVDPGGATGTANAGRYHQSIATQQWVNDEQEASELRRRLDQAVRSPYGLSVDQLRRIASIVAESEKP